MALRVAFRLGGPRSWTGGVNYILNMCRVLKAHAPGIEPVIFAPADIEPWVQVAAEATTGAPPLPLRDRGRSDELLALAGVEERRAVAAFRAAEIDLVFESVGFYGRRPSFPMVSWLPDFQHRALPHLFTRKAWHIRDARCRMILASREHILLSSEDARADLLRYYGRPRGQVHVVPFAVRLEPRPTWADGEAVRLAHGLPEHFLFMPNQFWVHKNHRLVVEALGRMAPAARPTIAATGSPHDPRAPDLMDQLKARIAELGVTEQFRLLGMLPYRDILALNARCDALVNPSLFEGWSTTVEEAKALGTPMILSDLSVHREQVHDKAIFFDPHDAEACMAALGARATDRDATPDQDERIESQLVFAAQLGQTFAASAAKV